MYRFFPSVFWNKGYPGRKEIVEQVTEIWHRYGLEEKTNFDTKVESVREDGQGRWIVNDISHGKFDGILAAIGSCGDPKMSKLPGQEKFKGDIYHSSQLDGKDVKGKNVLIVGGGASAVEAMEFVAHGKAKKAKILARVGSIPKFMVYSANPCAVREMDHPKKSCRRHSSLLQHLWSGNHLLLDPRATPPHLLLPRLVRHLPTIRKRWSVHRDTHGQHRHSRPDPQRQS